MLSIYQFAFIGVGVLALVIILWRVRRLSLQELAVRLLGVIFGLIIGALASVPLSQLPAPYGAYAPAVAAICAALLLSWIASGHHDSIVASIPRLQGAPAKQPTSAAPAADNLPTNRILIDTSATIDGRIADIVAAGFIPGTLVAPKFMLAELQNIADSEDAMRRGRGRRGLEVLNRLREMPGVTVEILDEDVPGVREVDAKLVTIAGKYGWSVLTTDYNLNRVAQIQGVKILNVNELSNAIRPEVLPGENMVVKVVQLGKERGQGVGYLADGTMVVVDNGDKLVGQEVAVEITRAFQTVAGKMIFAAPKATSVRQQPKSVAPAVPSVSATPPTPAAPSVPPAPAASAAPPQTQHQPQPQPQPQSQPQPQPQPRPAEAFVNGSVAARQPLGQAQPQHQKQPQPQSQPQPQPQPQRPKPQRSKRRQGSAAIEDRLMQITRAEPAEPTKPRE